MVLLDICGLTVFFLGGILLPGLYTIHGFDWLTESICVALLNEILRICTTCVVQWLGCLDLCCLHLWRLIRNVVVGHHWRL